MSFISEQNSVSSQVDTIMKNRYRRFRYLMRNDRMDDAMAIADEFYEWIDPDFDVDEVTQDEIGYFCEDELEEQYHSTLLLEGDNE